MAPAAGRRDHSRMTRTVLAHGLVGGLLIAALQLLQYRLLVVEHALAIYGGLVALLFAALGLWLGRRLAPRAADPGREVVREVVHVVQEVVREVPVPVPATAAPAAPDAARLARLGITPREHETLQLIAEGLSNRDIAERLGVSENTVKTHASRLLAKLDARRRTQAVQRAKEVGLLA